MTLVQQKNQERERRDLDRRALIGGRFHRARELSGLTVQNVAAACGISPNAVNGWENGQSIPKVEHLLKVQKLYRVSVDWLLGIAPDEPDPDKAMVMEAWDVAGAGDFGRASLLATARLVLGRENPTG